MKLDQDVADAIEAAIRDRFGESVQEVRIASVDEVDGQLQVRIEILFGEAVASQEAARAFFGLTRRVREAMGDEMTNLFPILRPISTSAHA